MTEEELFRTGIYEICSALHMAGNGSADPLDDYKQAKYIDYLKRRLATWTTNSSAFDAAMQSLIVATLFERGESVS